MSNEIIKTMFKPIQKTIVKRIEKSSTKKCGKRLEHIHKGTTNIATWDHHLLGTFLAWTVFGAT